MQIDIKKADKTKCFTRFFGADDEIWTHAAVSRTTPLAGEPLEPLGYICISDVRKVALALQPD